MIVAITNLLHVYRVTWGGLCYDTGLHVGSSYTGLHEGEQSYAYEITMRIQGTTQSYTAMLTWDNTLPYEATHCFMRLHIDMWGFTCSFTWGHTLMLTASMH